MPRYMASLQMSLPTMRTLCGLAFIAVCLLSGWPALARADVAALQAALGEWRVTAVKIDDSRSGRLLYERDDPQLVGRRLHIGPDAIRSDLPERRDCSAPTLVPGQLSLDELLRDTMPTVADRPAHSYQLPPLAGTHYAMAWLRCGSGRFGPALPPRDAASDGIATKAPPGARTWLLLREDGRQALLRWYDATLLVLTRADH